VDKCFEKYRKIIYGYEADVRSAMNLAGVDLQLQICPYRNAENELKTKYMYSIRVSRSEVAGLNEVICARSHGLVRQVTRLRFTCQLAQTGTNLAISEIIDHVGNVPRNCCLFIYGLHNGTVNIVDKLATSIAGMMSDDCWDDE
jgi:hemolysin activation/secretion protein